MYDAILFLRHNRRLRWRKLTDLKRLSLSNADSKLFICLLTYPSTKKSYIIVGRIREMLACEEKSHQDTD